MTRSRRNAIVGNSRTSCSSYVRHVHAIDELARSTGGLDTGTRRATSWVILSISLRLTCKRGQPGVDPLSGPADASRTTPRSTTGAVAPFARISRRSERRPTGAWSAGPGMCSASAVESASLRQWRAATALAGAWSADMCSASASSAPRRSDRRPGPWPLAGASNWRSRRQGRSTWRRRRRRLG